jgi:hypothetical protein
MRSHEFISEDDGDQDLFPDISLYKQIRRLLDRGAKVRWQSRDLVDVRHDSEDSGFQLVFNHGTDGGRGAVIIKHNKYHLVARDGVYYVVKKDSAVTEDQSDDELFGPSMKDRVIRAMVIFTHQARDSMAWDEQQQLAELYQEIRKDFPAGIDHLFRLAQREHGRVYDMFFWPEVLLHYMQQLGVDLDRLARKYYTSQRRITLARPNQ